MSTQPTMQGAKFRTLSKRALWAPGLAPALAALLAMLLTLGLGQMQTAQAQAQAILYVDTDATGATHDGLSWTTAYTTVQDALDVANADQVKGGSQLGNTQLSSTQLSTNQLNTSQLNTQSKQSLLQQIRVAASSWRVVL